MPRTVLVLFAHPAFRRSRSNRALRRAAEALDGVTLHDLYETYPDFAVDVDREQALVEAHDALVCLHPFFWYSAPALVKEWLDLVLEHGWAYGDGDATRLAGKDWLQAVTVGGPQAAYAPAGPHHFTMPDLLRPFEATATLCGMRWREPFVLHAADVADDATLTAAAGRFADRLVALRDAPETEEAPWPPTDS